MPLPTQSQLLLPLLAALADGVQSPREAADRLATEFAIPPEDRERRVPVGTRRTRAGAAHTVSLWQRTVRWVYNGPGTSA